MNLFTNTNLWVKSVDNTEFTLGYKFVGKSDFFVVDRR